MPNPTVLGLRVSLGLPVPLAPTPPPTPTLKPRTTLESEIRLRFGPSRSLPQFWEEYPSVFCLAGLADADLHTKLELIHTLVVEPNFSFAPELNRVARRALHHSKLQRMASALAAGGAVAERVIWGHVAELRDLMLDIVAVKCRPEMLDTVCELLHPGLIAQMISKDAYSPEQFVRTMDATLELIEQAAPVCAIRFDVWFRPLRSQLLSGLMGTEADLPYIAVELLETLQDVKLELTNWRLVIARPTLVQAGADWEQTLIANLMHDGTGPLSSTVLAIQGTVARLQAEGQLVQPGLVHKRLMLEILTSADPPPIPEAFSLDQSRIRTWRHRIALITLSCALWAVGRAALAAAGAAVPSSLLTQLRYGILEPDRRNPAEPESSMVARFLRWLHAVAEQQGKCLRSRTGSHLSSQLIAVANPTGRVRALMMERIVLLLQAREAFGGHPLAEGTLDRSTACFGVALNELGSLLDTASSMVAHLEELYYPMYLPFVHPTKPVPEPRLVEETMLPTAELSALVAHAERLASLGDDELPGHEQEDEEDEEGFALPMAEPVFKLALPGLQSLTYRRSTDRRASSCDNLLVRQSSACSLNSEGGPRRQRTIDLPLLQHSDDDMSPGPQLNSPGRG